MKTPATEPRLACDRHDTVLALALGALALAQRVEEAVRRASTPGSPALEADDPIVLATLGVLSLGRSSRRWLMEAAEPRAHSGEPLASTLPAPPDLLR